MGKSRSFSIYLLKQEYTQENSLRSDHNLDDKIVGEQLPDGAKIYVMDLPPSPPWWRSYFGISQKLTQSLKGAIVFLPTEDRTFAITFGNVSHNLLDASYEHDFGIRVTLNCVDPKKLKSTDTLEPLEAKRRRTQLPIDSELTLFDFDRDSAILKSLTGKVNDEYNDLFSHATGATNIRVSSIVAPSGLKQLCTKLLILYSDRSYLDTFPGIQSIAPVRDPETISLLNELVVDAVKQGSLDLALSVPAIIDHHEGMWARFAGAGKSLVYDDVYVGRYYDYLDGRGVNRSKIDFDTLKQHRLILTDADGLIDGERYPIFKCLIFDATLEKTSQTFHLCDGSWYLVETSFVDRLRAYLDPLCEHCRLPEFDHPDEGAYNAEIARRSDNLVCLDKTSITPQGQKAVEPCDLFEINDQQSILHHVKISTLSSQLSHLFNQGTNSIHLLRDEDESVGRLKALLGDKVESDRGPTLKGELDATKIKVAFGIITHKDPAGKSNNLPLFSRITLLRTMKDMKRMGVDAGFYFIKDARKTSIGKPKKRNSRTGQADSAVAADERAE